MHGRADGGSQEYHTLYSIISDCLNGSLLWLTNFHNLVNPYMTIKDSGLRHFKDMDKPILIFKDINCLWFFSLASFADYFYPNLQVIVSARSCRCKAVTQNCKAKSLQSFCRAERGVQTQLAIFCLRPGPGGSCCRLGLRGNSHSSLTRTRGSFATLRPGRGPGGSQLAISLRN